MTAYSATTGRPNGLHHALDRSKPSQGPRARALCGVRAHFVMGAPPYSSTRPGFFDPNHPRVCRRCLGRVSP